MAEKRVSRFQAEAAAAIENLKSAENINLGKTVDTEKVADTKVPMNITILKSYKKRLQDYAKSKGMCSSAIIQMWIDENCN